MPLFVAITKADLDRSEHAVRLPKMLDKLAAVLADSNSPAQDLVQRAPGRLPHREADVAGALRVPDDVA